MKKNNLDHADNFNSIKVQLEQKLLFIIFLFALIFQFHKGTIRTGYRYCRAAKLLNFNSIKVQLEHILLSKLKIMVRFQFHKGTIRTHHQQQNHQQHQISIP